MQYIQLVVGDLTLFVPLCVYILIGSVDGREGGREGGDSKKVQRGHQQKLCLQGDGIFFLVFNSHIDPAPPSPLINNV